MHSYAGGFSAVRVCMRVSSEFLNDKKEEEEVCVRMLYDLK